MPVKKLQASREAVRDTVPTPPGEVVSCLTKTGKETSGGLVSHNDLQRNQINEGPEKQMRKGAKEAVENCCFNSELRETPAQGRLSADGQCSALLTLATLLPHPLTFLSPSSLELVSRVRCGPLCPLYLNSSHF